MSPRVALVTGVAGQDGVHLARDLLAHGVSVVGTVRPGSSRAVAMAPYLDGVRLVSHDLLDAAGFAALVREVRPTEIYNLAGLTSVGRSWSEPEAALAVNRDALVGLLAGVRAEAPEACFVQAGSAERGESPYAQAKAAAGLLVAEARASGMRAAAAVLHNHESAIRPAAFVTRKITVGAASIARGVSSSLTLGNLSARRDWGSARDHTSALRLLAEAGCPDDVEIGTGVVHALSDLLAVAFDAAGLGSPDAYVATDPGLLRPQDTAEMVADPEPAATLLGWRATHSFEETVTAMVRADLARIDTGVAEDPAYLL